MRAHNGLDPIADSGAVPRPSLQGPVTGGGGRPWAASIVDLDQYGYTEAEYLVSGSATVFAPQPGSAMGVDGRWQAIVGARQDYTTRILVRTPTAERFNGTVVIEFMQEYFGTERDTNFRWNAETLLREGFAWVGASLHHEGIDAPGGMSVTIGDMTVPAGPALTQWDADRYGTLAFPHSDLCYDVLSQIAVAVGPTHAKSAVDPLAGLMVQRVLAVGNTIAAARLQHYINAVQPLHRVFAGFYLQDLNDAGIALSDNAPTPADCWVRTDVDVPVMVLNTMTAAVKAVHQPEGPMLRFWEPAGSSHTTGPYMVRVAEANQRDLGVDSGICPPEIANTLPVQYISGAALVALHRWAAEGVAAPSFPRLSRTGQPPSAHEDTDEHGNALGGLRNPWVDVPIARYDWRGDCLGGAGRTYPFTAKQLTALYGEPSTYHRQFETAVRDAQTRGVLLADDATDAVSTARKITW
ncbi:MULTISPECIES: alpha/beta hydrolase domain-containing protein [Mycobacteriaceae]|uniref:alpha/beta hydrolase domain-containing protein n=1 Tax=Mycobacteriaceae TaxID=1762 RepID=UPI0009A84D45|nr:MULTISPECIES: alpha/beta hydrolase domain-containing protein [Mycobacteriaceae]QZH61242.1 hypothetical protein K1X22_05625 [Mycolicibacterium farcinogenes]SKQ80582.1 Uncharacterised protein [Mycobacteroides abscessus subsp. massiliense]